MTKPATNANLPVFIVQGVDGKTLDIGTLVNELSDAIKTYVDQSHADALARIKAVETDVRLRDAPRLQYRGAWSPGIIYEAKSVTSHNGCMWECRDSVLSEPGTANEWELLSSARVEQIEKRFDALIALKATGE